MKLLFQYNRVYKIRGQYNMKQLSLKAYAKINIGLDVLKRREDGYHELRMVMQTVGLSDTVVLSQTVEPGIFLKTDRPDLPVDRGNLAYRAAELLFSRFALPGGIRIGLEKHIPAAAGLAGGSADAAAVLRGMHAMYQIPVSLEELSEMSLPLGADVPYCVLGGTALAEGIGEKLSFLPAFPDRPVLIAKPVFDLATPYIYKNLHVDEIPAEKHPDMDAVLSAIGRGDAAAAAEKMENILEVPALRAYPEIEVYKEALKRYGALGASMTGSGSAVFGIFAERRQAEEAAEQLSRDFAGAFDSITVTEPVRSEDIRGTEN